MATSVASLARASTLIAAPAETHDGDAPDDAQALQHEALPGERQQQQQRQGDASDGRDQEAIGESQAVAAEQQRADDAGAAEQQQQGG